MVGFISEPTTENLDPVQKLKNSSHPLDPSDQKATDFSFSDSFPDFDSIKDWFEDIPVPGMADIGLFEFGASEKPIEPRADGSNSGVKVKVKEMETENLGDGSEPKVAEVKVKVKEEEEWEKLGNFSKCIEEEMGRVSLDVEPGNLGLDGGGGSGVKSEVVSDGNESGSLVSSSESSESESDSSSSEEGASSSDSSDDEEEKEGGLKEVKVEATDGADEVGEVEEGEIRDANVQEMVGGTEDDDDKEVKEEEEEEDEEEIDEDDGKLMASFSDFEEDEDDEGAAPKGPIRSKHELEVRKCHFGFVCLKIYSLIVSFAFFVA